MPTDETNRDADIALALSAVTWAVAEPARADRLVALTGLAPADLRAQLHEPALLAAILRHLEAHEPDLMACANTLDVSPLQLIAARSRLEGVA